MRAAATTVSDVNVGSLTARVAAGGQKGVAREVSSTQAEAAVMAQVSSKFEDTGASLNQILTALMTEVDSVRAEWVGRGGASFQQVTQAWGEDQRRLLRALSETATAIRTAGRSYQATDDAAADRMQVPGVTLPL